MRTAVVLARTSPWSLSVSEHPHSIAAALMEGNRMLLCTFHMCQWVYMQVLFIWVWCFQALW